MLSWRFMIGCQFCSASSCVHKHNAVWVSYPCNQFYPPIELRLEKFTQYFKTHINFLCHYPLLSLSPPFALQALSFFAFPPFWFQRCNYPWQTTGSDPRFVSIHHRNICIPPLLFRFRVSLFFFLFLFQVYPLFAAVGAAVGICGFQLVRNICINPEVRSLSPSFSELNLVSFSFRF